MMVQHHVKYEETHGVDEIVMMDYDEHRKLHTRLRKEGKCTIPVKELHAISQAAYERTGKGKESHRRNNQIYSKKMENKQNCLFFYETVGVNALIEERIRVNPDTGTVRYVSRFKGNSKLKLMFIDI